MLECEPVGRQQPFVRITNLDCLWIVRNCLYWLDFADLNVWTAIAAGRTKVNWLVRDSNFEKMKVWRSDQKSQYWEERQTHKLTHEAPDGGTKLPNSKSNPDWSILKRYLQVSLPALKGTHMLILWDLSSFSISTSGGESRGVKGYWVMVYGGELGYWVELNILKMEIDIISWSWPFI